MFRILAILLAIELCLIGVVCAQDQPAPEKYLDVRGISELEMEPLGRATVNLYEGTTKIKSIQTGADGSFSFRLDVNKQYTIEVEKEGLISKRISFNTQMPEDEKGTWMNEFSIGLLKPCSGMDYSVLKQPVDQVKFDARKREFLSDKDYATSMRSKIESLMMKNDQCLMNSYESLVKKGDQIAAQKKYDEAINTYKEAQKIFPNEEYPARRIAEMNAMINKQQNSADMLQKLVSEADALTSQGKMTDALAKYKQAVALDPANNYSAGKIAEIEGELKKQQSAQQARQSIEDRYNQAMAKASVAYTRKDFAAARTFYQEALSIKPGESLPMSRVKEIEVVLEQKAAEDAARASEKAKKEAFEKEYLNTIAQADALFKEKKFEEAQQAYAKAITMKPSESYPAQRIKTIENARASEQANLIKTQEEGYNAAMAAANNALAKEQFELAKESYRKALTIKPDDLSAKSKLAQVDQLVEQYNKRKSTDEQYSNHIQSGDALMSKKEYSQAKASYAQALTLKPGDKYAQTKIAAVDNLVAAEQALVQKRKAEAYNQFMGEGNNALALNQFAKAKESYGKALLEKPEDPLAKSKLAETGRLADNYAKQQSVDEQYKNFITAADARFSEKDYTGAKENYSKAVLLKPGDKYAQTRITSIDNLVAAEQASNQKRKLEAYNQFVSDGTKALKENQFQLARQSFEKALTEKPDDAFAKSKIVETDRLAEAYKKQMASEVQYKELIQTADAQYTAKDYSGARENYNKAALLKPSDKYASSRVLTIDNLIAAEQAAKAKAIEDGYQSALGAANTAIAQKSFTQAKEFLQKALTFKPGDVLARNRIADVERMEAEQQRKMAEEQKLSVLYKETISAADKYLADKDYSNARLYYNKALQIKVTDGYASQKLASIDNLIAAEQALKVKQTEESFKMAMDKGNAFSLSKDYGKALEAYKEALSIIPANNNARQKITETESLIRQEQERMQSEQARKKKYDETIRIADQYFNAKNYTNAKTSYEAAQGILPGDTYSRQRIDESVKLIAETEKKLADEKALDNAYNLALSSAEKSFAAKDFVQAKNEYGRALQLKPAESLPKTRITEIEKIIAQREKDLAETKARAEGYTNSINAGNQAFERKDYATARTAYNEALKYMPGDGLASDQIKKIDYLIAEGERVRKAEQERKAAFDACIRNADQLFDEGKYPMSKEQYKKALTIDPSSAYAKQKIEKIDDINRKLAQAPAKSNTAGTTSTPKVVAAIPMGDINFKTESERQLYLDNLKNKYPSGITLEVYKENYKETFRYIIIRENQAQEFRRVHFKTYNGDQYSVNGKPITQQYFTSQVKTREGESFREIQMQ